MSIEPRRGSLMDTHISILIGKLYQGKSSGVLHLLWASMEKTFWIRNGQLIGSSSSLEGEHPLDFIIPHHSDFIPDYENLKGLPYRQFLEKVLKTSSLDPELCKHALVDATHLNFATAMNWFNGEYVWDQCTVSTLPVEVEISIPHLLWQQLSTFHDASFVARLLGGMGKIPLLNESFHKEAEVIPFNPEEAFTISRIDGVHTIEQIIQTIPINLEHLQVLLHFLNVCGWLRWVDKIRVDKTVAQPDDIRRSPSISPTPSQEGTQTLEFKNKVLNFYNNLERLNDEALLSVTSQSHWTDIEHTYQELMEYYHPSRCSGLEDESTLKTMVESIRGRLTQAFKRLEKAWEEGTAGPEPEPLEAQEKISGTHVAYWRLRGPTTTGQPSRPPKVNQPVSRERSYEILIEKANEYLQVGDNYHASQCLEGAVELFPNLPEPYFLLGTLYESHPRLYPKALNNYLKAHELEPANSLYLYHIITLLSKTNQFNRALRYAEKLRELGGDTKATQELIKKIKKEINKSKHS